MEAPPRPFEGPLCGQYFVLRHGRSIANEQGLIVSSPRDGVDHFGLTEAGIDEVRATAKQNRPQLEPVARIYSSDFLRARETAEIVAESLKVDIEIASALRERSFGDWDGKSNENYQTVWEADAVDASHQKWSVESVSHVADRTMDLVTDIDRSMDKGAFLLVSHGDPLQILLTAAAGNDLRTHRSLRSLETAELRPLLAS